MDYIKCPMEPALSKYKEGSAISLSGFLEKPGEEDDVYRVFRRDEFFIDDDTFHIKGLEEGRWLIVCVEVDMYAHSTNHSLRIDVPAGQDVTTFDRPEPFVPPVAEDA